MITKFVTGRVRREGGREGKRTYLESGQCVDILHVSTFQATTIDKVEHPPVIPHGGNEPVPVVRRFGLPEGPAEGLGVLFWGGGEGGGREDG